jgi:dTDP-4-amino-4,6-dideoxygalactose transaminase
MSIFPNYISQVIYWDQALFLRLFFRLMFSGKLNRGQGVDELREYIEDFFEGTAFVPMNSGTSALELGLDCLKKLQPSRRRVILPVYACPSILKVIRKLGLTPVFAPVKFDLTIDPDKLPPPDSTILAIIIPHIYGYSADIKKCIKLVRKGDKKIVIIDDAAPAFGSIHKGKLLGSYGDLGVLSFGPSKRITATAGGGLLINEEKLYGKISADYGRVEIGKNSDIIKRAIRIWWDFYHLKYSSVINYKLKQAGFFTFSRKNNSKSIMSNLDAALVLAQLPLSIEVEEKRLAIMKYYQAELASLPGVFFPQLPVSGFPLQKFYFRIASVWVERDRKGKIISNNPLIDYLKKKGIKAGYGYQVVESGLNEQEFGSWQEQGWLDELIQLPVDHNKQNIFYKEVIDAIKEFLSQLPPC